MFNGITPTAQLILSIGLLLGILCVIIFTLIIVWKKGVKLGLKSVQIGGIKGNYSFPLTSNDLEIIFEIFIESVENIVELGRVESLSRKMDFAEDRLKIIQGIFEKEYAYFSQNKVKEAVITDHEDFIYFKLMINNCLYDDRAKAGIKGTIRRYFKSQKYKKEGEEYKKFLKDFTCLIMEHFRDLLNRVYKTEVFNCQGEQRTRIISNTDIYILFTKDSYLNQAEFIFKEIFDFAKQVDIDIEREKKEKEEERKKKILQFTNMKKESFNE